MKTISKISGLALAAGLMATPAMAHPGHVVDGLGSGFAHPFLGIDHMLAMAAVGIWAAMQPAGRAVLGPLVFVACLALGAVLGFNGASLPLVEPGILASVVLLGLLVAGSRYVPASAALAMIGGFALMHGHAHGVEATGAIPAYMVGFIAASAILHAAGFMSGRIVQRFTYGAAATGLAIAASGLALLTA